MPTNNPRVNVTFSPKELKLVSILANEEKKSISMLVKELTLEALERREDRALSEIASEREQLNEKLVSHKDAWK